MPHIGRAVSPILLLLAFVLLFPDQSFPPAPPAAHAQGLIRNLIARLRAKEWLNAADFDKGLAVARTRHPQPQAGSTSVIAPPIPAIEPIAPPPPPEAPKFEMSKPERSAPVHPSQPVEPQVLESPPPVAIEPPKQESPDLQMKIDGGAKFARPWRIWIKKT